MSLLAKTSSANRIVEQGNTFTFTLEPAQQRGSRSVTTTDSQSETTNTTTTTVYVTQWRVTAHLAKRYRYVGLTGAAAVAIAAAIAEDYLVKQNRYALEQYTSTSGNATTSGWKYQAVANGDVPMCCASVTPAHVDGSMWEIEVDVDATIEAYYDSAPTVETIRGLFSSASSAVETNASRDITNFPEKVKTYYPATGNVTTTTT